MAAGRCRPVHQRPDSVVHEQEPAEFLHHTGRMLRSGAPGDCPALMGFQFVQRGLKFPSFGVQPSQFSFLCVLMRKSYVGVQVSSLNGWINSRTHCGVAANIVAAS